MFGKVIIDWQNRIYVEGFDGFTGILWHDKSSKNTGGLSAARRDRVRKNGRPGKLFFIDCIDGNPLITFRKCL